MRRLCAFLLLLGLCGCGTAAGDPAGGGRMVVVDESDRGLRGGYASSEYPDIGSEPLAAETVSVNAATGSPSEMRAVWFSYLEMDSLLKGKSEAQFRSGIGGAFDKVADFGLNTVIVQVRPFGDALYDSSVFPWSYTITGTEGKNPGFDPLSVMVGEAKARGLRIEAWVNPYRIRSAGNSNALSGDNPAKAWMDAGDGAVISYGGVVSYNPGSKKARELIVSGIREIVKNYQVDGVHIDDYFYPTTDAEFDISYYKSYQDAGGTMSLENWRRANVEALLQQIYTAVKEENPKAVFGVSPEGNITSNYNKQYLDVKKIAAGAGYCDYLCPQLYYGFENGSLPYGSTLADWNGAVSGSSVRLYVGLAAYKVGEEDTWAGSGSAEWQKNKDLLRSMVEEARGASCYGGFVLYRYDSLFNPDPAVRAHAGEEAENLRRIL